MKIREWVRSFQDSAHALDDRLIGNRNKEPMWIRDGTQPGSKRRRN